MLGALLVHRAIWKNLYFPLVATRIRDTFLLTRKAFFLFNPSRQNHLRLPAGWSWWGGGAHGSRGHRAFRVPGRDGFLSLRCTCNTTVSSCRWQIAAETHSLESRCLRCFSLQTLLRWASVGRGGARLEPHIAAHPRCSAWPRRPLQHAAARPPPPEHYLGQRDGEYLVMYLKS